MKKETNRKCKGMRDLLVPDMRRFRRAEDTFRSCCRKWGFQEVRTPVLEYMDLFTSAGTLTPSMLSKVYSFLDWDGWSGERVVLRPDVTIPIARLYIDNLSSRDMSRLFYVADTFVFEGTGKENRERWQCGVELLGGGGVVSDVEMILLAREIVQELGLNDLELRLSHAGLAKALIGEMKLSSLAEISMINDAFLHNVESLAASSSASLKKSLNSFGSVMAFLERMNCDYQVDFTAAQGFEYYTGICFQLLSGGRKIGGGGRYDDLIPLLGGEKVPACGFAFYLDSVADMLPDEVEGQAEKVATVKSNGGNSEAEQTCFVLARALREAGYAVELEFNAREKAPEGSRGVAISVDDPASFIVVTGPKSTRQEVASVEGVLALLGEQA